MKGLYQQIEKKYKDTYFKLKDVPPIGQKVVYLPFYDLMLHILYDGYYSNHSGPGDILTVKDVNTSRKNCNGVFFEENDSVYSAAELIPAHLVEETDRKLIQEIFQKRKRQMEEEQAE